MATENQFLNNQLRGVGSRAVSDQVAPLVVAGTGTVKAQIAIPDGSWLKAFAIETPTAISGVPTTCNVRIGTTDGGQEIVADVDCKGQAHVAATIVAALDKVAGMVGKTILYTQVVTTGGTAPAGTINVIASYSPATL